MWKGIARVILRNRVLLLAVVGGFTLFMGYQARKVEMSYEYAAMLPKTDSAYIDNQKFLETFDAGADVIVVGVQDKDFFRLDHFQNWVKMGSALKEIDGVEGVLSPVNVFDIQKDTEERKFKMKAVFPDVITSQEQLDSLSARFKQLPFYKGNLYNDSTDTYIMAVTVNKAMMATPAREKMVNSLVKVCEKLGKANQVKVRYSGMPYIRVQMSQSVKKEFFFFTILALIIVVVILYLFFRSFKAVFFPTLIVLFGVVWAMGLMGMLGYKITILSGMIPPLLIVIGIPNCIFLLNKYHQEYVKHGNQVRALHRTIIKIGSATFLTNLTTASGFATFIFTKSDILKEFGLIASVNIIGLFAVSLIFIPVVFSFLAPPNEKDTLHLKNNHVKSIIDRLVITALHHRRWVYGISVAVLALGTIGITQMKSTGYIVDDLPQNDPLYLDLKFFEENLDGLMPLEVMVDTRKPNGVLSSSSLSKLDKLNAEFSSYDELSGGLSLVELLKFAKQGFYNGKEKFYSLPNSREKNFILSYLPKEGNGPGNEMKSFLDSTRQIARVSFRMKDIGTERMELLYTQLVDKAKKLLPSDHFDVIITGGSVLFFKGTEYLVSNLLVSLALAIALISCFMALMFNSRKMVLLSLVPNIIPLIFTTAIMGIAGIPIKASTILVFSITFGISVDNTIHFLAKYRQELKLYNGEIGKSVIHALKETGVSMLYTSVVLFFGFGIFSLSSFGGTQAMGILVSLTLLTALLANLLLLPSMLMWLQKRVTTESFKEPLLEIFDEEEDIELEELKIDKDLVPEEFLVDK